MTNKRVLYVAGILLSFVALALVGNVYLLSRLNDEPAIKVSSVRALENLIRHRVRSLKPSYLNRNPRFFMYRNRLLRNYKPAPYENASVIWDIVNWWPAENEIYPMYDSSMGQLLSTLSKEPITRAQNSPRGTQLKLVLKLANQQKVIFKPQWYGRDEVIDGPVYGGKDRHNAEIYAFYLAAVLNLRWTPIAVGRKLDLKEIYQKADQELKNTMLVQETSNGTEYCVYGKCHYCTEDEPVCADENNLIEGAIIYLIPGTLSRHRSPWQRTYKDGVRAAWEDDMNYCIPLKDKIDTTRLLDLIDASIFDFLIQNGDRHHYETRGGGLILIDNGKAFGNPNKDFFDVLAPLYQCCILRKTTWDRLLVFSGGTLTDLIDRMTKNDELYPIINKKHKQAVERRLLIVYSVVEYCLDTFGEKILKS